MCFQIKIHTIILHSSLPLLLSMLHYSTGLKHNIWVSPRLKSDRIRKGFCSTHSGCVFVVGDLMLRSVNYYNYFNTSNTFSLLKDSLFPSHVRSRVHLKYYDRWPLRNWSFVPVKPKWFRVSSETHIFS